MFPSVMIFVLLLSAVYDVLVYSQGCIANKKSCTNEIHYCCCQFCLGKVEYFLEDDYLYAILLFHIWIFVCVSLEGMFQQERQ